MSKFEGMSKQEISNYFANLGANIAMNDMAKEAIDDLGEDVVEDLADLAFKDYLNGSKGYNSDDMHRYLKDLGVDVGSHTMGLFKASSDKLKELYNI